MSWISVAAAVGARPVLWRTALRQVRRTAAPGWYRRFPYLPLPPANYVHFRLVTQYGDPNRHPEPQDVIKYLAWCREWDKQ